MSDKSEEWHAERRTGIGGSDAAILLSGDPEKIHRLWLEKTGQAEPEDLTWVLPVQMGGVTEELNCRWYEHATGRAVTDRNRSFRDARHDFMRCEVDGLTTTQDGLASIFEAKHVNAFRDIGEAIQSYMPQLHHNMHCARLSHAVLSIFKGTQIHDIREVELDPFYLGELIEREIAFWTCVEMRIPPGPVPSVEPPAPVERTRVVDMTGNNEWGSHAAAWLEHKAGADKFDGAKKGLKGLMEADVARAHGHGVIAFRDKAAKVTIKAGTAK